MSEFHGIAYRTASNWFSTVDVKEYQDRPINYLEIGVFYGANVISVETSYCAHPESKIYCVDPWEDYDEYNEYKNEMRGIYATFLQNIQNTGKTDKFVIQRGYSNKEVPKFTDEFFDIIYIDGNHESKYVLEDAVVSFPKLKKNGILIFDDHSWATVRQSIEKFKSDYADQIEYLGLVEDQVFIRKL